ncbi:MAG: 5-formyltetrahydrofolate cyclo-ligase [Sedimentisphaerales bacterium]|nr:5-formyltetrahydrofolate cyclo-ligase [Sedimentisphaerales bacterium]
MDKAQLRRQLKDCLLSMTSQTRSRKSSKACRNLISIPQFQNASTVMMFLSFPDEVDTSESILCAWQLGKTVAVPKVSRQHKHMIPVQINSLETGILTETSGLKNPTSRIPMAFEDIDLVLTPGLGFDKKGNRLGRGGSYYDRFFANAELKASRCGFGFAEQFVEIVPVEEHDEPVDMLVTDEEIIYFNQT